MIARAPLLLATTSLAATLLGQDEPGKPAGTPPMYMAPASDEGQQQIRTFQLPKPLVCDLLAAEPDLCNGVALSIDGKGRVFVAETFRIKDGVFDTRDYMQWKDDDLACLTVADRVRKYEKHIAKDIPGYSAFSERIRLLTDTDRNGTLDRSTIFADGFHELADGIGSGVLPVGNDVFFTNIPKLWRLRDTNGDGVADERTALHDGYGVHTSLIGHDLHGLIVGPDRRLYFSIGDRGFHVQQGDRTLDYPHEGAVLRCELDGSELEVVHRGLRNPQELAFDAFGDLFTGDNNSDGGDKARFVQVLPGADSGWRIGYQWLSDRGAWNREKMWHPRHAGQSAGIVPPIANVADGPSGLAFDPGIGLPERFRGCFFLCDFRGGASNSGVLALRLDRAGAGFELASMDKLIWRVLATDCDFAPDGSMYVLDWVDGWNKTGKGRVYRVRTPEMGNDLVLRATAQLLGGDFAARGDVALQPLLAHQDRRVRQQAQFALVDLGAREVLLATALAKDSRLARQHALWGLGILGRRDAKVLDGVLPLLDDGDADVRATAARVLGDARLGAAIGPLEKRLGDGNARVRREAAFALARCGQPAAKATKALLELLRKNDDHDAVLRHAAVFALASVAPADELRAAAADASTAVRRGVLLALARRQDAAVATFLTDADVTLRFDASRAIYEQPIPGAMQKLAELCYDDRADTEAIDWRAIAANRLLGTVENGEALVHVAGLATHPAATRREALDVLGEWRAPHGQCRVTGNWRPCEHPRAATVADRFAGAAAAFFADPTIAATAASAAAKLGLTGVADDLGKLVAAAAMPDDARVAALDALATLKAPQLGDALAGIGADAPVPLRRRAVALLSRTEPGKAVPVLATLLANGSLGEKQAAFEALAELRHPDATALLRQWLERLAKDDVDPALRVDVLDAAAAHGDDAAMKQALAAHAAADEAAGPLGPWRVCADGGDAQRGRKLFFDNEATRCTRCHSLGGNGGNAGPALDSIGRTLTKQLLLEALITPSARIAEGFGTTMVDCGDGATYVGVITKDQDGGITIVSGTGEATDIPWTRLSKRTPSAASSMPPMGGPLSRRQVRDVIAFLAQQKKS